MPEIHLRQAGFTYKAFRLFTKIKDRIHQFKKKQKLHLSSYIYKLYLSK